jgi:hypothetical protein
LYITSQEPTIDTIVERDVNNGLLQFLRANDKRRGVESRGITGQEATTIDPLQMYIRQQLTSRIASKLTTTTGSLSFSETSAGRKTFKYRPIFQDENHRTSRVKRAPTIFRRLNLGGKSGERRVINVLHFGQSVVLLRT